MEVSPVSSLRFSMLVASFLSASLLTIAVAALA